MNKFSHNRYLIFVIVLVILSVYVCSCLKTEEPTPQITFGTFPDSVINMEGINSAYDDYNISLSQITGAFTYYIFK